MASRVRDKIKFASVDELLGVPEVVVGAEMIDIKRIHAFHNHPFKVLDDDRMKEFIESIKVNGVLTPVLIRPDKNGDFEMISGHRRMHAAKLAGLDKIPAHVKEMNDDEATIAMVDANVQREEILPSEKAFSLKMKMDAMRYQGACRHDVDSLGEVGKKTASIVGESSGMTGRTVQRYIRLTEILPELLSLVDSKRLQITLAVEISYFDKDIQKWIYEYIKDNGFLKPEQIAVLREHPNLENVTQYTMIALMNNAIAPKKINRGVKLSEKKLDKYFDKRVTASEREKIIIKLLEQWKDLSD